MWTDRWMDRKTDKKRTNGQKNGQTNRRSYTNFERNLAMMVIYVPVKYEFDWTNRFQVRIRKQNCRQTDGWTEKQTKNRQTNRRNFTNFERNLAMMVIYVPVKFDFDWSNHFRFSLETKMWTDRWMDRTTDQKRTNGQKNRQTNGRNFTNFERNLAMMVIYLPVKFEFDWSNHFQVRVRKRKCGQTDGWTNGRKTDK